VRLTYYFPRYLENIVMITTLQDILKEYKSDMERMEHRIHASLGTDVPLIQQVSKYILGAGGKRLRPLLHLPASAVTASTMPNIFSGA